MKKWFQKMVQVKGCMLKEENSWMWSLVAILALLTAAFVLLYYIYLSAELL